ncbi:hypothetical protein JCM8202v2_001810 [Rhodotorula sphaerocarpa]
MASLLERTLGAVRKENTASSDRPGAPRRVSGGGAGSRASPYARPDGGSWKHDRYGDVDEAGASSNASRAGPRPSAGRSDATDAASPKLMITNLHYEVSERELEVLFVQIGPIAAGPKIKKYVAPAPTGGSGKHANARHSQSRSLTHDTCFSSLALPAPSTLCFDVLNSFKFDRSGRSEGVAWVTYTSEKDAAAAKEAFDGAFAKGEPIKVDFDHRIDRPSERGPPAAGSLLARVGGAPDSKGPKFASAGGGSARGSGPRHSAGSRSERGVGASSAGRSWDERGGDRRVSEGAGGRGGGGGRGGRGGAGGRGGGERVRSQPKSGGDLDAELEAFMKAPSGASKSSNTAPSGTSMHAPEASAGGDVEMS